MASSSRWLKPLVCQVTIPKPLWESETRRSSTLRFGPERIAGIDGLVIGEFVDAEERPAAFAQVLDGEAEHRGEDQQRVDDDAGMAVRAGIVGVEVVRVEMQRQRREEGALRLGDGAAPMVLEHAPGLEVLIAVPFRDQPGPRPEILCHSYSSCGPPASSRLMIMSRLEAGGPKTSSSSKRVPVRPRRSGCRGARWRRTGGSCRAHPAPASPGSRTWSRSPCAAS